jgi:hypothetical protein
MESGRNAGGERRRGVLRRMDFRSRWMTLAQALHIVPSPTGSGRVRALPLSRIRRFAISDRSARSSLATSSTAFFAASRSPAPSTRSRSVARSVTRRWRSSSEAAHGARVIRGAPCRAGGKTLSSESGARGRSRPAPRTFPRRTRRHARCCARRDARERNERDDLGRIVRVGTLRRRSLLFAGERASRPQQGGGDDGVRERSNRL